MWNRVKNLQAELQELPDIEQLFSPLSTPTPNQQNFSLLWKILKLCVLTSCLLIENISYGVLSKETRQVYNLFQKSDRHFVFKTSGILKCLIMNFFSSIKCNIRVHVSKWKGILLKVHYIFMIVWTNNMCAEHPFASQNPQHLCYSNYVAKIQPFKF